MTLSVIKSLLVLSAVAFISGTAGMAQTTTALPAPDIAPDITAANENYLLSSAPAGARPYQSALSANGQLYVTSAMGKKTPGAITVLDAQTLETLRIIPPALSSKGRIVNVFGIAVDDAHGRIWTSNTLDSTVTVYDMQTGDPVKLFDKGTVSKPRDVVIDQARGRAYVNTELTGKIAVFDTETLEQLQPLLFAAPEKGEDFATLNLDLDAQNGRLYAVSRNSAWVGWINVETGETTAFHIPQIDAGMGIAHDPDTGRIYVSGLKSENIVTLDATGTLLADLAVGTGVLGLKWQPQSHQLFGAARTAGKVLVLDGNGRLVTELLTGHMPNHLSIAQNGGVYLVSMNEGSDKEDETGFVTHIAPRQP